MNLNDVDLKLVKECAIAVFLTVYFSVVVVINWLLAFLVKVFRAV
jgi:hypothetical protein